MTRTALRATLDRLLGRLTGRDVRPAPVAPPPAAPSSRVVLPDHQGVVDPLYAPSLDGDADPGEIVWGWVPYEEDTSRGKDRPVLVIARNDDSVLGLMLTSKDHSRNAATDARHGRVWLDIGSGPWDSQRRPSEVRLDRVVQLHPTAFRREGAVMDRALFDHVTAALRDCQGW